MDFRKLTVLALVCVAVVGCRRDPYVDAYFDMLNAEKRVLEDRLYETQYNYEKALKELDACRAKKPPADEQPSRDDRDRNIPPVEEPDFPDIDLPPGLEDNADGRTDQRHRPVGSGVRLAASNSPSGSVDRAPVRIAGDIGLAKPIDQTVAAIRLNARRTGGMELDGRPGDDALSVLIEPRNAQGQFVAKSAAVSIVLLDPSKRGEEARFARWDFDREMAQRMLKTDGLDRGLHIRVPWPDVPPDVERLHLFVRYTADDERSVEADREILVRSPDLVADRWTPRADSSSSQTAQREAPTVAGREHAEPVVPASHQTPARADGANSPPSPEVRQGDLWSPARR
ncbi:MAG: hypothetical protein JJ992_00200 [Planctomycetes bacterium]|nr:hypothetical protein [Planctomycetota bacterium]